MLKESFFFLPSYKYGHLTRNFFCGTNIRRRRRGRRFPCFCRVLLRPQQSEFDTHYFDPTIPGDYFRRQLRLNRDTLSVLLNILRPRLTSQNVKRKKSFTELTGRFITWKRIFVCCSQKVVLRGRTTAPLKICLRGQSFVRVETSRSHLAWSTNDRNLTDFLVIKTNLSKFCPKCDLGLIQTDE